MNLDELKHILDLVREHELSEFEVEQDGFRLKIRKDAAGMLTPIAAVSAPVLPQIPIVAAAPVAAAVAAPVPAAPPPNAAQSNAPDDVDIELAVVKSPIVGTFYRSPEPGAPSFVEVGSAVKKGQVLCIIEAMKLMNEIDSEYEGEIVNVYVESGQPVQYGERLFAIRTR